LHHLQEQRISLSQSKQKLAANIIAKRARQAPMRTLLPEICSEIFSYCALGNDDLQHGPHSIWFICAPAVLSNVCRRWRDMVVNNPILWTRLCIRLDDKINHTTRAKLWATRSQQLPLHITLQPSTLPPPTGIPDALLQRFMHAVRWLSQHVHRAKSLTIEPGIPIIPLLLLDGRLPAMPHLRSLILETDDKDDASIVQSVLDAPLLNQVKLRDLTSMARILHRTLEHLTILVITYNKRWVNPAILGDALSSCVRLVDCTITFPSEPFPPPQDPILLLEVRRLEVHWRHQFDPASIAGAFRAPRLEHLVLSNDTKHSLNSRLMTSPLKNLFISAPHLQRLTFFQCTLENWYDLLSVLVEARNLSQLEMFQCQRGSLFLMSLTPQSGEHPETWFCPRIRRLSIDPFDKWDVRPILDFVRKRMYTGGAEKAPESDEFSYFEELELPRDLGMLGFQSRVYMRSQLRDIAASGRVRILGSVVG
ncbi:hypothetical protein AN958_09528, partial [Leucoagaricus sp. SymC.cos]